MGRDVALGGSVGGHLGYGLTDAFRLYGVVDAPVGAAVSDGAPSIGRRSAWVSPTRSMWERGFRGLASKRARTSRIRAQRWAGPSAAERGSASIGSRSGTSA